LKRRQIHQLKGMNDLTESEFLRLREATDKLQHLFGLYGYHIIDTPLLEETELFLRKSGGEMGARLYAFTDPGGDKISLRPEFTASVIRRYIQSHDKDPLPIRWQYSGPVFRYEQNENESNRQYTQLGAEMLGADSPEADAEIVAMAWYGACELGVSGHRIQIGHVGAIQGLLREYGLTERALDFLVESLPRLAAGSTGSSEVELRGRELGLLGQEEMKTLSAYDRQMDSSADESLLQVFLKDRLDAVAGQRTPEEIFQRFLRKARGIDDSAKLERALNLMKSLAVVKGSPDKSLKEARTVAKSFKLNEKPFDQVSRLIQSLENYGLDTSKIKLDFSLAKGFAYYTGVIFRLTNPSLPTGVYLGGGGRYDSLVKALGGSKETPAIGFAFNLERTLSVIKKSARPVRNAVSQGTLLVSQTAEAYPQTLRLASKLRSRDTVVQVWFGEQSKQAYTEFARQKKLGKVVVVDKEGHTQEIPVKVGA